MNFIDSYIPDTAELSQTDIVDTRDRLERYSRRTWPNLDTSPNTVLGDLILTPLAYNITALETAIDRFASDLDLGNIANDIIYNCEFVKSYIENFNVTPPATFQSSGVVRLTFEKAENIALDRGLRFNVAGNIFSLYLPNDGPINILIPGSLPTPYANDYVLLDTGTGNWFVDIPIVSYDAAVGVGTTNVELSDPQLAVKLVSAVLLTDIQPGEDTQSLPQLAKRARISSHSASLNTRAGTIMYLHTVCPFVQSMYAILSGDSEMVRDKDNMFQMSTGAIDVYTRSKEYEFTTSQNIKLVFHENGEERWYEGEFTYTGQPYYIESVTHANYPEIKNLEDVTITSKVPETLGPVGTYTAAEKIYIRIKDIVDENGDSVFEPVLEDPDDEQSNKYTYFIVTYRTDPNQPAIAQTLINQDYRPVNTSTLVRGFIPVIIKSFNVLYIKEPGRVVDFDKARDEIKIYLGNLGAPYAYSDGEISKILYEAGAKYVQGIEVDAYVQWAVGDKIQIGDAESESVLEYPQIKSSSGLRVNYIDNKYAATIRNIRYYTLENSITFEEVREM